jgi:hypothetical protein
MSNTAEPNIKFSNEESKANIRAKLNGNLLNLVDLTRSIVRSSESNELFRACFKTYLANEPLIESGCEKLKKVEIISQQLNLQVEAIKKDCQSLTEVCDQINAIHNKRYSSN